MSNTKELEEQIALLKAENDKLKKQITLSVSTKGCIQINGIRRFPFTFYIEEYQKIRDLDEEIAVFIEDNKSLLATKQ